MRKSVLALALTLIASQQAYALDMTIPLQASFAGSPRMHLSCDNIRAPTLSLLVDQHFSFFGNEPGTLISVLGTDNKGFNAHGFSMRRSDGDIEVVGELNTNADLSVFVNYMRSLPTPKITLVLASQSLLLDMQMATDDGAKLANTFYADCSR